MAAEAGKALLETGQGIDDYLGQPVCVGDQVAFVARYRSGSSSYNHRLECGTVERIGPLSIGLRQADGSARFVKRDAFIRIPEVFRK